MKSSIVFLIVFLFTGTALADDIQYNIRVDGITCPFCVATSEQALKKIEGVHSVGSDLKVGMLFVCADSQVDFTDAQLKKLFLDKGFTYRSFEKKSGCSAGEFEHSANEPRDTHDEHSHRTDS